MRYNLATFLLRGLNRVEDKATFIFMMIMALLMLLVTLSTLYGLVTGSCVSSITKLARSNPSCTLADIEADFGIRGRFEKDTKFLGRKYFIYVSSGSASIIILKDIVWAYYKTQSRRGAVTQYLVLRDRNGKTYHEITINNEKTAETVLREFNEADMPIITGYTDELKKMYNKNLNEFIRLADEKSSAVI